jgi:hypothetical protein
MTIPNDFDDFKNIIGENNFKKFRVKSDDGELISMWDGDTYISFYLSEISNIIVTDKVDIITPTFWMTLVGYMTNPYIHLSIFKIKK